MSNFNAKCDREALAEQVRTLAGKYTSKQIAQQLGHTPRYILNIAYTFDISLKAAPLLDRHDLELIVQLIRDNMPRREIAEKFEVSEPTLSRYLTNYFAIQITH